MKFMLHEMSWIEAKEWFLKKGTAVLPVGSTEQHGPHNPLGTDFLIAEAVAKEAAERARILCLPVIPFGVSSHHKEFWGTIFISPRVFQQYVKDACLSLNYYGIRKIVIVNGHGGNRWALMEMAADLREKGVFVTIFQWWDAVKALLPDLFEEAERSHAGAEETSMNLAVHSRLVNMSQALDEMLRKVPVSANGVSLPMSTVDLTSSGVFGKSKNASKEKGERVFEAAVDELVKHIELLKEAEAEDLIAKTEV